ncbi:MAG: hypothetical protein V4685_03830 [Bacteroidota bacterium]
MQNFSKAERIAVALYFIWFFLQLALFFYADEDPDNALFWPFTSGDKALKSTYDVLEFVVYAGAPLIFFIAYRIVFGNDRETSSGRRHSSSSFFIAFLDEKIKAEELTQKLNELQNRTVSYNYLNELKADKEKVTSHSINNWFDKIEIKKKYKEFES